MFDGTMSPADISAMMGNNNGNGSWIWLLIILFFIGGNGWGNRQGEFSQYATAASQNEILSGQKFDALSRQINQVGDGLCSSTYALNNSIINEGRTLGNAINTGFANIQNCCCDLKYEMANQFANTNANTTAQVQKILDAMSANRINELEHQVSDLKTQSYFCGVPRISNYAYGVYPYATTCGCNQNI